MAKHILNVKCAWDIRHDTKSFTEAMGVYNDEIDFLVERAKKHYTKRSEAIESIVFDNSVSFQTRICAIFFLGQESAKTGVFTVDVDKLPAEHKEHILRELMERLKNE